MPGKNVLIVSLFWMDERLSALHVARKLARQTKMESRPSLGLSGKRRLLFLWCFG